MANRGEDSAVVAAEEATEEENPVSSSSSPSSPSSPSLSSPLQPDEKNNDNDNVDVGGGVFGCIGEFDCPLCLKLLYVPTTADCGHSFCQRCAYELIITTSASSTANAITMNNVRLQRQRPNCPICRSESLNKWSLLPSITLEKLLRHSFPEEYAKRKAEEEEEENASMMFSSNNNIPGRYNHRLNNSNNDDEWPKQLPLFVLDPILPGQRMFLHVFELRYRLLIQRAIADHGRKFGMVGIVPVPFHTRNNIVTVDNTIANQGTEVEITNCRELPDGRFQVEIIGKLAFQIIEKSISDDGYWEATVEPLIASTTTTTTTTNGRNNDTVTDDVEDDQHQQQEQADVEEDSEISGGHDGNNGETDTNQSTPVDHNDDDNGNSSIDELVQTVVSNYLEWENCIRTNLWERHESQMDEIKRYLGERPSCNDDPDRLALWIAAAINPLPPLSVAMEIRLHVLAATNTRQRFLILREALDNSLKIVSRQKGTLQVCGITIYIQTLIFGVFLPILWMLFQAHYTEKIFLPSTGDLHEIVMRFIEPSLAMKVYNFLYREEI